MTCFYRHIGELEVYLLPIYNPTLERKGRLQEAPASLAPDKLGTPCSVGWVSLGTGADGTANLTPPASLSRIFQSVASSYTFYAILAANYSQFFIKMHLMFVIEASVLP